MGSTLGCGTYCDVGPTETPSLGIPSYFPPGGLLLVFHLPFLPSCCWFSYCLPACIPWQVGRYLLFVLHFNRTHNSSLAGTLSFFLPSPPSLPPSFPTGHSSLLLRLENQNDLDDQPTNQPNPPPHRPSVAATDGAFLCCLSTMDRKALDVLNGGGVIDFYQRFQQLQLQRDTSDELIKVRTHGSKSPKA